MTENFFQHIEEIAQQYLTRLKFLCFGLINDFFNKCSKNIKIDQRAFNLNVKQTRNRYT